MGNTNQEPAVKARLYNSKQLVIATIIGGPAIAGVIVACNLWARDKKWLAILPVLPGILLGFAIFLLLESNAHLIRSFGLRHILFFALYFFLQGLFALLLRFIISKNEKAKAMIFPEFDKEIYHRRYTFPIIIISIIYLFTVGAFNIYLWSVLVFYIFTHIYIYISIHKTFGNLKTGAVLAAVVILGCLLPLVDTTSQILSAYTGKEFFFFTYLNLITGYYAVFILYIFLLVLTLNILLLINRLSGLIPGKNLRKKPVVFFTIFFSISFGASVLLAGSYINNNIKVNRYSITIPRKSSELNSLKIISISDLHLKNLTSKKFLKNLSDKVRAENPDIIFFPGDIAETYGHTHMEKLNEFIEILKDIKAKFGIYAVKGNHDYPGVSIADKIGLYNRLGITMLADSVIESTGRFYVTGLKYRGNNVRRPVDSLMQFNTKDLPVILLDHAPYCLEEAIKIKVDVQLSGHTHYGQLWPLNYITGLVYDIAWGYKKIDQTNIFVSCGVQDALMPGRQDFSIPVRTGSVSEIMEINIEFR